MRRKLSLIVTLFAWLLATGSHWDLVQTFAWGRMIVGYARTMPLTEAVRRTFSPETMCPICRVVAAAKQEEDRDNPVAPTQGPREIVLVCTPRARVFLAPAPQCVGRLAALSPPVSADRPAPPLPPPRAVV